MIKLQEKIDPIHCMENPTYIFVFGDNLIGKGKAGQAVIRDNLNSFGVPTKRLPSMSKDAFFSDREDEYKIVKQKLIRLWELHQEGKTIVLPKNKIGSGLAKLSILSPKISALVDRFYSHVEIQKG